MNKVTAGIGFVLMAVIGMVLGSSDVMVASNLIIAAIYIEGGWENE